MKTIEQIREDFPILSTTVNGGKPLLYFDSAATAQKPLAVIETVNELHRSMNANIHRGIHYLAEETTARYEAARETVRHYINAASTREIVFTSGATGSINLVAQSFGEKYVRAGDNIILTEMEHHSNIVPWQLLARRTGAQLRVIPFTDDGTLDTDRLPELIDDRTRLITVTQASNVLGTEPDLKTIIEIAHAHDIPVLVDGCQAIVHAPVDVRELDCDFYVFSGHKLYGPTGTGVLYGKEKWLEAMPPYQGGGDMIATVSLTAGTTFAELPLKFEAGTANYIGAIGLGAAIEYLESLETEKWLVEHEKGIYNYLKNRLTSETQGITLYGTVEPKSPILSFTYEGTHPADIGMIVDKMGLAMRTGTHCAEPVMEHYGITAMCRLSVGLYNTLEEAEMAVDAIKKAVGMLR